MITINDAVIGGVQKGADVRPMTAIALCFLSQTGMKSYHTCARTIGGRPDCIINPLACAPVTIQVVGFGPTD